MHIDKPAVVGGGATRVGEGGAVTGSVGVAGRPGTGSAPGQRFYRHVVRAGRNRSPEGIGVLVGTIVDGDGNDSRTRDASLVRERQRAGVVASADRRGHARRQEEVWVGARDGDPGAGGPVVGERRGGGVGVGDGEVDDRLGDLRRSRDVVLVGQRREDAGGVVEGLHQHAGGGGVGAAGPVRVASGDSRGDRFQRSPGNRHARGAGVDVPGVGRVGQRGERGVDVGLAAGERQRLGAAARHTRQVADARDVQRAVERGECVNDAGRAVGHDGHLLERGIVEVVGLPFREGDAAGVVEAGRRFHRADVGGVARIGNNLGNIINTTKNGDGIGGIKTAAHTVRVNIGGSRSWEGKLQSARAGIDDFGITAIGKDFISEGIIGCPSTNPIAVERILSQSRGDPRSQVEAYDFRRINWIAKCIAGMRS